MKIQNISHDSVYIGSFYRPPDKDHNYTELLREPLESISKKHRAKLPKVVLTGDFNFPGINWSDDVAYCVSWTNQENFPGASSHVSGFSRLCVIPT